MFLNLRDFTLSKTWLRVMKIVRKYLMVILHETYHRATTADLPTSDVSVSRRVAAVFRKLCSNQKSKTYGCLDLRLENDDLFT